MEFKPGILVVLKSGGPLMTIEELGEHNDAYCVWFVNGEIKKEWLSLIILRKPPSQKQEG